MIQFNSTEFANIVKNYRKEIKFNTSDSQVKYEFSHICLDKGYAPTDVLCFLYEAWRETYPNFERPFSSRSWESVIKHSIKEAENEYDWELAKKLSEILANAVDSKKEKEEYYRTQFFALMSKEGIDTTFMEMDMYIDLWGWTRTLDLIIYLADKDEAKSVETETGKVVSAAEITTPTTAATIEKAVIKEKKIATASFAETTVDSKMKKFRNRVKYLEIQQLSKEGEIINTFKNIAEAAKSGNFNHASISKCLRGEYKTAEGYKWVGIKEDSETGELTAA